MKTFPNYSDTIAWHPYATEKPVHSGTFLVLMPGGNPDSNLVYPETAEYFRKGEVVTYPELKGNTPEERLLDLLNATDNGIKAYRDGFYARADGSCWMLNVEYWSELPRPPYGTMYEFDAQD